MEKSVSVIIPSYNRSATIGKCLESVYSSSYRRFEVIVVDDCSTDDSMDVIRKFPCSVIRLDRNSGASAARNAGAKNSRGEILFFMDSDCLLQADTLSLVEKAFEKHGGAAVIGGTYTQTPFDDTFFSTFQSVFINYSETKNVVPDYIPSHAMVISAELFGKSGGFDKDFLPILEDVEFSHRLRKSGCRLVMAPEIEVRHVFNFTMMKSFRNAFRKSSYWTFYSLHNKDLFRDSGTASSELKTNVVSGLIIVLFAALYFLFKSSLLFAPIPVLFAVNLWTNRRFLHCFYTVKGLIFALKAGLYYIAVYPLPVGAGAIVGILRYLRPV